MINQRAAHPGRRTETPQASVVEVEKKEAQSDILSGLWVTVSAAQHVIGFVLIWVLIEKPIQ